MLKRKSEIQANSAVKCPSNWVFKQMKQESHFLPLNHLTAVTKLADAYIRILILFEQEATVIIYYLFVIVCIFPLTF